MGYRRCHRRYADDGTDPCSLNYKESTVMEQEKKKMIEIICDRPSHIYRVGEKAKFTVNSTEPGVEFEAVFTADGEAEIARVKGVTPCTLKQTLLFPGFLRCAVTAADGSTALAGAGFDPAAIRAVLPEPDDLEQSPCKFGKNPCRLQDGRGRRELR